MAPAKIIIVCVCVCDRVKGGGAYLHFDGVDEILFLIDSDLSVPEGNQYGLEPPGTIMHKLQRCYGLGQLDTPQRLALYGGREGGKETENGRS